MQPGLRRSFSLLAAALLALEVLLPLPLRAQEAERYIAVIDAGSSGSRIHLYARHRSSSGAQVRELLSERSGEALSSFDTAPAEAGVKGLQPLLNTLSTRLDQLGVTRNEVHLHLLATAGMRRVEQRNPDAAAAIYAAARSSLTLTGMRVGRVETLSGQLEGAYAWVDVNYLNGSLSESGANPVGMVEVGGASAQIAYQTHRPDAEGVTALSVNGRTHYVVSISWLGLGQDEARRAMIQASRGLPAPSGNPCYPNNASNAGGLSAFSPEPQAEPITNSHYRFRACSALYEAVLKPFRVGGALSGETVNRWVGVSSVFFALSDWQALANPEALGRNLQAQCEGVDAYGTQVTRFIKRDPANRFAQNACANGTFVHALLFSSEGLGLQPEQVQAAAKLGGNTLSWTRGFALVAQ